MAQLKKYLAIILISLTGLNNTYAQILSVQASVDTNIILLGDQVKFYLEVNQPASFQLNFPILTDTLVDKIEIIENLGRDTIYLEDQNQILIRQKYLITSFDSGIYIIPPMPFTFKSYINNSIDTIATTPIYFGVMTMALDTANPDQIAGIKLPYKVPLTFREIVPYLGIGLAVLIVVAFIIYYFVKRKKNEKIFVRRPKPKQAPHVIAYHDLDKLKKEKLWQKSKEKEYFSRLTEILRIYIENRFFVRAMEQTTDETIESFKENQLIDSILFDALKNILQLADLVKFAKAIPLADENAKCLNDAYIFIDKTKQVFLKIENENDINTKKEQIVPALELNENTKALSETNTQNGIDS